MCAVTTQAGGWREDREPFWFSLKNRSQGCAINSKRSGKEFPEGGITE